ncbi:hypothetical protein PSI23_19560, partial [Xenorhabdus sp. XENO-10]
MNNIFYHTRVNNERLEKMSNSDLQLLSSSSREIIHSITAGIKSIANLAGAAVNSEEYSPDDAMTDLD